MSTTHERSSNAPHAVTSVARTHEREITTPLPLCTDDGRLHPAAIGWSRTPLHACNLTGHRGRKKRWNHWAVTTDECLLAVTYADIDYIGLAAVLFVDIATGRMVEKAFVSPAARGFALPEGVREGRVALERDGLRVVMTEEPHGTRIEASFRKWRGSTLDAQVFVAMPRGHETLNVVIPWSEQRFQFTSKHEARPAEGAVTLDGRRYEVSAAREGFGCLDFGRGVWPHATRWNWGAASGHTRDGRAIGINLGGKWTDGTGMTENGFVLDGRLHKLGEDLRWDYDRRAWMRPWEVRAPATARVGAVFRPLHEKSQRLPLGALSAELHFMIGRYSAWLVTDEGERVEMEDVLGWAEEFRARW